MSLSAVDGAREVRDVLGDGVLRAHGARVDAVGLAGFGEGVVARIKVLAFLEVLGEVVGSRGEFAVEAEEALLFGRERLGEGHRLAANYCVCRSFAGGRAK